MSGAEKAAALMVAIGPENASMVLKHLDEDSVTKIVPFIARIETLSVEDKEEIICELLNEIKKIKKTTSGGESVARELLTKSLGEKKTKAIFDKLERKDIKKGFDSINHIDPESLVTILQDEHPQIIAATLAYLPPKKSAEILKHLPSYMAKDISLRIAKMDTTSPEAIREIVKGIKNKYEKNIQSTNDYEAAEGVDTIVEILNNMAGDDERRLIDHFDDTIPIVADKIKEKIFTFDYILYLNNMEIQILIDEIDDDYMIAKAIKAAGDEIRFHLLRNMSQNRATDILTDMDSMGPITMNEVEEARGKIIAIMRNLKDNGIIAIRKEKEKYIE